MGYSHKASPPELRAKHTVRSALGRGWARTIWRGQSSWGAFEMRGAIVWGIQRGAMSGNYGAAAPLKEHFRQAGLLLGGANDDAYAMLRCMG